MSEDRIAERFARMRVERAAKWARTSDEEILRMRIAESEQDVDPVTKAFLGLTVPMWIELMRPWRPERREQKAHELGELIAYEQGVAALCDPEARGTARKGELGKAFNAIAQGLACLAFCPGGIVFAGHHWEALP
jgi:hypothetical protein